MKGKTLIAGIVRTIPLLLAGLLGAIAYGPAVNGKRADTDRLFSQNYGEARKKFLEASRAAGASVESYRHPLAGPGGEPLGTDVALLGPGDATSVLVVISGTHGVEGFAGSALQTGLLGDGALSHLEPGQALLMIHALNPYGFAHLRRFNEENVDLNRNFVDHSLPYSENPGYEQLHDALAPASHSFPARIRSFLSLVWYRLRHGKAALKDAVTLGQYTHPDGLFYGGRGETWSNRTLRAIVTRYLSGAERVTVVEVHTGLGDFGEAEIILNERSGSPAGRRARRCWGDLVKATGDGESVSRDIVGSVKRALPSMLPNAEVTAVSLEFGTYPARRVLRALIAENWLHHHGESGHPDAVTIREDLREAFDPDSGEWRERVWSQGGEIVGEALRCPRSETPQRKYMEGAEPLFLEGGTRGLLLIHGAGGGTAWDMKEFAAAANRRGWTVWLLSLPGFGTRPEDLIGVTAGDWLDESRNGVNRLAAECTTVAVVGHSVGGALALLLAAEDPRVVKTVSWSAPWKINNRLLPLLPLVSSVPLIRRLVPERVPVDTPAALKDEGWVGYEWLPGSIGLPVLDVLKKLHEDAGKITSPVFLVQGTGDVVIDSASADRIQKELAGSEKKSWIIDGGSHVLMQGPRKDELFARTLAFIEKREDPSFP